MGIWIHLKSTIKQPPLGPGKSVLVWKWPENKSGHISGIYSESDCVYVHDLEPGDDHHSVRDSILKMFSVAYGNPCLWYKIPCCVSYCRCGIRPLLAFLSCEQVCHCTQVSGQILWLQVSVWGRGRQTVGRVEGGERKWTNLCGTCGTLSWCIISKYSSLNSADAISIKTRLLQRMPRLWKLWKTLSIRLGSSWPSGLTILL